MFTEAGAQHYRRQWGIQIAATGQHRQSWRTNHRKTGGWQHEAVDKVGGGRDDRSIAEQAWPEAGAVPTGKNGELVEFLSNFSMHCYRWLAPTGDQNGWVVTLWSCVHLATWSFLVCLLINAWLNFNANALVTTLSDTLHPIDSVPFPGISICSNNRISLRNAQQFAEFLYATDPNRTQSPAAGETDSEEAEAAAERIRLSDIRYMGSLIDTDWESGHDSSDFQAFLDAHDAGNGTAMDVWFRMRQLVPNCTHLMLKCSWRGVERACMQLDVMFEQRRTQYGHCCTFNYVRTDLPASPEYPVQFVDDFGPELGLVLLLNGTAGDYFYPLYNFLGFIVQVFNPTEFPDVPSGSVSERLVELGYETFIRIDSTTVVSDDSVRDFSPQTRGCLFADDLPQKYGGRYKRSDCVVNCRISSIAALCGCTMYALPITQVAGSDEQKIREGLPTCTLQHVPCLDRYRIKWSTMLTTLDRIAGLEKEQEDGLYCPECLPSCSETSYLVTLQDLPLVETRRAEPSWLSNVPNVSNVALVRIFLGQPETWLYRQKQSLQWFEILSNIGGVCGVISGFSLISLAEVVYFLSRLIWRHMRNCWRQQPAPAGPKAGATANEVSGPSGVFVILP